MWWVRVARAGSDTGIPVETTRDPVVVDGALDESAWSRATPASDLVRYLPTEGPAPAGTTEVRFLQDQRHLYVGIRVRDAGYRIRARVSPREAIDADDRIGIALDTFHDGRSGYIFEVNPLGVQKDVHYGAGLANLDWNTSFRSAGHADTDGYTVEVAIPWRSLKYPATPVQDWGLIVTRATPHDGSVYAFPLLHRNLPVMFAEEGTLTSVRPPAAGSGLELVPAATAWQGWVEAPDGTGPALDLLDLDPWYEAVRPSLDACFGLTPDLAFAATLNPDFSQVESDLPDVRLNPRFAYQFPERRPFFLDGVDAFQDPSETLYTRSIVEPLYGAKVTGRSGPVAIGVVHALDRSPMPSVSQDGTPGFDEGDVEGRWAETTAGRVRLDAFESGAVGVTLADKRILASPARDGAAGVNDTVALDLRVPFGERWYVSAANQHSLTSDGAGTPTWGMGSEVLVSRTSGIGTGIGLAFDQRTVGFRRETGFMPQSGFVDGYVGLDQTVTPGGVVDTWTPTLEGFALAETDGDRERWIRHGQDLLLGGVHTASAAVTLESWRQQGVDIDGWVLEAGYGGQIGRALQLAPSVTVARTIDFESLTLAESAGGSLTSTLRPTTALQVDLTLEGGRTVPQRRAPEDTHLVRARLAWQFTRQFGARLIGQEAGATQLGARSREALGSVLLTWLSVPGTAVYAGWTETVDLLRPRTVERTVFLKLSASIRT